MSSSGGIVPTSGGGSGTITEITSGDDSITITNPTGPTVDIEVNGSAGRILATTLYAPPESDNISYNITAATPTAIDPTNASILFIVPGNGVVDVQVDCQIAVLSNADGAITIVVFALLDHITGDQYGFNEVAIGNYQTYGNTSYLYYHYDTQFHIEGLTPFSNVHFDLAACLVGAGTQGTAILAVNGTQGAPDTGQASPLSMKVIASI